MTPHKSNKLKTFIKMLKIHKNKILLVVIVVILAILLTSGLEIWYNIKIKPNGERD